MSLKPYNGNFDALTGGIFASCSCSVEKSRRRTPSAM
jgi:hypothetical protein